MGDRLTAAAVLGGLRQRAWSLLIVSAFLVLAAAGAAGPIFAEASDNAAFRTRLDDVPATARQSDAAVVRISANVGPSSADQQRVVGDVRTIPGLSEPDLTGGSVGAELVAPKFWSSTVTAGGARERARLFAVTDPATDLVPVGPAHGRDGVWLPEPMARELGVRAGGRIEPTAELDDDSAALVLRLLRDRAGRGSAVVLATHDARAIAAADTVLRLRHGVLTGGHDNTTAIDGQGRIQLPEEALPLFPDGRAVVTVVDGHVELHRPE
nr:ABC transporter ATP-binding protein [uncultured Actinoplanes sp.]